MEHLEMYVAVFEGTIVLVIVAQLIYDNFIDKLNMYKVDNNVLDRIKKHLKATKKKLFADVASLKGGSREKLAKENDALIKLIEDNYPG